MDRFEIQQAAVWHRAMFDYDPAKGNEILAEALHGYEDRMLPVWTILPEISDTSFAQDTFLDKMKENGVKMLKAFPLQNRYILCDVTMGDQLKAMGSCRFPFT